MRSKVDLEIRGWVVQMMFSRQCDLLKMQVVCEHALRCVLHFMALDFKTVKIQFNVFRVCMYYFNVLRVDVLISGQVA